MGAAAEKINETVANAVINIDDLFDEVVLAKTFLLPRSAEAEWKDEDCEEKWVKVFPHFKHQNISVGNLRKVMEYIFCLPGTSAFAEKNFFYDENYLVRRKEYYEKVNSKESIDLQTQYWLEL